MCILIHLNIRQALKRLKTALKRKPVFIFLFSGLVGGFSVVVSGLFRAVPGLSGGAVGLVDYCNRKSPENSLASPETETKKKPVFRSFQAVGLFRSFRACSDPFRLLGLFSGKRKNRAFLARFNGLFCDFQ